MFCVVISVFCILFGLLVCADRLMRMFLHTICAAALSVLGRHTRVHIGKVPVDVTCKHCFAIAAYAIAAALGYDIVIAL